ncbi:MAG: mandelate racemase/muconate lactonizing enzyme family protein [Bryobacterales bacterium]|nr:mandelate racemase/muconate lactonizing enzyme family protein [Bryobacterales bacterium]
MTTPNRRELLQSLGTGGVAASAAGLLAAAPRDAASIRISGYEVVPLRVPMDIRVREAWQRSWFLQNRFQTHHEPVLVKLKTDSGLVGIGDSMMSPARTKTLAGKMVGRSPWEYLFDDSIRGLLVPMCDIVGQALELPVSRLFARNPKKRIIQTWWSQCFKPELMASEAKLAESLGYRVHKVKARPWEDPIEQAEAICGAVSKDFRVWVDANAWWGSVGRTLYITERLKKLGNYFAIESPIRRELLEGYRQLKGKVGLDVTEHMPPDPMPYIREGLLDAIVVGFPMGQTLVQRALMAEVTGIPLWVEHSTRCGINQVFQAHQAAAFPGIEYTISVTHMLEDDFVAEPFEMREGFYEVPTKPGLGITLDEDAVDKYRVL